ncbi:SIR2 family protein [Xanthomonas citri]|uniref:SIR2 family protein n=1 Tax=Xanthomonas citri TaxID=346 RepID=UPI000996BB70|nr:SIR2 family protein [Xanthomonas citri]QEQ73822.1 SIR2 family protein [Xanthomonas citri pv. glycines]QTK32919.1 SIR2 family protein [Xanthomonas citri pv. glycines CFBP 2526]UIX77306.1 SIR2 family protein [Xanthomonas citri pv. glycines]
MSNAGTISVKETLDLLDGAFAGVSKGICQGEYAFWLGSGISRERVVDLNGVLAKLLDFLSGKATAAADCAFKKAFDTIIDMAKLSDDERKEIDLAKPVKDWPCAELLLARLWNQYSKVLAVEIPKESSDYLLWVGLDFPHTFASQDPDAEHLAIGMLALEGAVTKLATANWDGLLEAAMKELGYPDNVYRVTVTGDDLRGPAAAAILYKFHGCALRAIETEATYRRLLVARSAQITGWMSNDTFKIVRDQLEAMIQTSRTMMMGLSAQDENIKHLFGQVNAHKGWKWTDKPTPIVFSANELGDDQKSLLTVAYGDDYEPNRDSICQQARLQAYAKPLLLALLLQVLAGKLVVLAGDATAPGLDAAARATVAEGITHLRDHAAAADNGDRTAFVRLIAAALSRARHQLQNGTSGPGVQQYFPIHDRPVHMMQGNVALASTGQREAAVALGLIGLEHKDATWTPALDDPADPRSGALRVASASSAARVFLAANDDNITSLMEVGAFDEDDNDVVVICSRKVGGRQQRSPRTSLRDGSLGPRYVSFGPMLASATSLDGLRDDFRNEVSI